MISRYQENTVSGNPPIYLIGNRSQGVSITYLVTLQGYCAHVGAFPEC